jgi:succinoglycan biosynthesis transport protein ExoP
VSRPPDRRSVSRVSSESAGTSGAIDLGYVITVLRRRAIVVTATVCVITGLVSLIVNQLTPQFTATSVVMIEPMEIRIIDLESVVGEVPPDEAMLESQIRVLTSTTHTERLVKELGLLSDPEFNPVLQAGPGGEESLFAAAAALLPKQWGAAVSRAEQIYGTEQQLDGRGQPDQYEDDWQRRAAAEHLLGNLNVQKSGRSYALSISFTSPDPKKAAHIANMVAQRYVESLVTDKIAATTKATRWLSERADVLRQRVLASDEAIERYRASNELLDNRSGITLDAQQLSNLQAELIATQAERMAKEAKIRQVHELGEKGGRYEALADVMSSATMIDLRRQESDLLREEAELSSEYGPRHPRMLQLNEDKQRLATRIGQEIQHILQNLENELSLVRIREGALEKALVRAKSRSVGTNQAQIQLRQLEREAEANRQLYQTFLARLMETEEQQGIVQADARVISTASVPGAASFPRTKFMIAAGFTASLALGGMLAFVLEFFDRTFRSGRELSEVLGFATVGVVPSIKGLKRGQKEYHYLIQKPLSAYADAISSLRKTIELTAGARRSPGVVLVTSSVPEEGKTALAVSLAASAARSGLRTVVVDLDFRHPSVTHMFGRQRTGVDLVSLLTGHATLEEVVYGDHAQDNLYFIPVDQLTSDPVALLESEEAAALLTHLRANYDYVVLDTPPALGLTDTRIAALLADVVLLAVRWGSTSSTLAINTLEALRQQQIEVAGLVLTQVDLRRHAKYGYKDVAGYYVKYKKYYTN